MGVMNDPLTTDLFPQALLAMTLQGQTDLPGFRRTARALLAQQMLPEQVSWHSTSDATQDMFAADTQLSPYVHNAAFNDAPVVTVPPEFLTLCESVILHSDPGRFGLLYRILWRLMHEPGLRHDPLDADMMKAQHMAQAVRRDMHKMKAFVRFRSVQDETFRSRPEEGPLHVAWFEPEHHIVEAVAPFFARRFTQMRWAILTPECSVEWTPASPHAQDFVPPRGLAGRDSRDASSQPSVLRSSSCPGAADSSPSGASPALGRPGGVLGRLSVTPGALVFGPGARKEDAPPPDAGEQLWLTYYQHIFNPARLKMKMMQKEMPRKYWKNLPEADMIHTLAGGASQSSLRMIEQPATVTTRRMPSPAIPIRIIHEAVHADSYRPAGAKPCSLAELHTATNHCRECPIGACATQAVNGEGPLGAGIMFVGEQPGDHEDVRGKPFVGPAGQLLDRALAELSINREQVFVSNAVRHFKFELRGKRRIHKTPSQREASACLHWLEDEIALVKPGVLVALGATAARALMGRAVPVIASHGQILQRDDGQKVLITLHPSALLRMPPDDRNNAYAAWLHDLAQLQPK